MKKLLIAAAVLALAGRGGAGTQRRADRRTRAGAECEQRRTAAVLSLYAAHRPPTGTSRPEVLFFRRPLCGMIAA